MKTQADLISAACKTIGQAELARRLNVSPSQVYQWATGRRQVPVNYGAALEKAADISRRDMWPDDWLGMWPELAEMPAPILASAAAGQPGEPTAT